MQDLTLISTQRLPTMEILHILTQLGVNAQQTADKTAVVVQHQGMGLVLEHIDRSDIWDETGNLDRLSLTHGVLDFVSLRFDKQSFPLARNVVVALSEFGKTWIDHDYTDIPIPAEVFVAVDLPPVDWKNRR